MKYLIVFEKTTTGYSAYSPDIEGCVATGATKKETIRNMEEAIAFHLDALTASNLSLPLPRSSSQYVEV